jgi:hypothetical protein
VTIGRTLAASAVCLLAGLAAAQQVDTQHYRVLSDDHRLTAQHAADLLEQAHRQWRVAFARPDVTHARLSVVVHAGEAAFARATGLAAADTIGSFAPHTGIAHVLAGDDERVTLETLLHEAAHQFHERASGTALRPIASWYCEGMATAWAESFVLDGGRLQVRAPPTAIASHAWWFAHGAASARDGGFAAALQQAVAADRAGFDDGDAQATRRRYAFGALLVSFLDGLPEPSRGGWLRLRGRLDLGARPSLRRVAAACGFEDAPGLAAALSRWTTASHPDLCAVVGRLTAGAGGDLEHLPPGGVAMAVAAPRIDRVDVAPVHPPPAGGRWGVLLDWRHEGDLVAAFVLAEPDGDRVRLARLRGDTWHTLAECTPPRGPVTLTVERDGADLGTVSIDGVAWQRHHPLGALGVFVAGTAVGTLRVRVARMRPDGSPR